MKRQIDRQFHMSQCLLLYVFSHGNKIFSLAKKQLLGYSPVLQKCPYKQTKIHCLYIFPFYTGGFLTNLTINKIIQVFIRILYLVVKIQLKSIKSFFFYALSNGKSFSIPRTPYYSRNPHLSLSHNCFTDYRYEIKIQTAKKSIFIQLSFK